MKRKYGITYKYRESADAQVYYERFDIAEFFEDHLSLDIIETAIKTRIKNDTGRFPYTLRILNVAPLTGAISM